MARNRASTPASAPDPARAVCRACHRLARLGLIAGRAGNISVRRGERIWLTPRGVNKAYLRPEHVVETTLGAAPADVPAATVEYVMHRACYLASVEIGAVVHAHAPALTALGIVGLDLGALPEAAANVGGVALVRFEPSGSDALARVVAEVVAAGAGVLLLRGHGVVTVAADLAEAVDRLELAELSARAIALARALPGSGLP